MKQFKLITPILFILVLFSCAGPEAEFLINGISNPELKEEQEKPEQEDMIRVKANLDELIIKDISYPQADVQSRKWDLDGNGIADSEYNDLEKIVTSFSQLGEIELKLWVNGQDEYASHWIFVEAGKAIEFEGPGIVFHQPIDAFSEVNDRKFELEVLMENFFPEDSFLVMLNNKSIDFGIDDDLLISADLTLRTGENSIQVIGLTEDLQEFQEDITVIYSPKENTLKSDYVPPKDSDGDGVIDRNDKCKNTPGSKATRGCPDRDKDGVADKDDECPDTPGSRTYKGCKASVSTKSKGDNIESTSSSSSSSDVSIDSNSTKLLAELTGQRAQAGLVLTATTNSDCASSGVSSYSFSITPEKYIELIEFFVYSDICGGLRIILYDKNGEISRSEQTLNPGKTQITLDELYAELAGGTKYTLKLETVANFGGCNSVTKPKLKDFTSCSGIDKHKPEEASVKFSGKSIIHNLKYDY